MRAAHLVSGQMDDFIKFDDDFAIVKMPAPEALQGRTIDQSQPRKRHRVNIVGVKPPGEAFVYAQPETMISPGDTIVVSGDVADLEHFADHT